MRLLTLLVFSATLLSVEADPRPLVDIVTSKGTIRVALFADEAPETVANFLGLAEGTKPFKDPKTGQQVTRPFYDGLIFHRVIPTFMIQGGCPFGEGNGDPGYTFKDEINATSLGLDTEMTLIGDKLNPLCEYMGRQFFQAIVQPKFEAKGITQATPPEQQQATLTAMLPDLQKISLRQFYEALGYAYDNALPPSHKLVKGSLAMANSGPATNGSQFFINLGDTPHLAGKHTVFGEVVGGMDVVDAIGAVQTGPGDKPVRAVTIVSIRRARTDGPPVKESVQQPLPGPTPAP